MALHRFVDAKTLADAINSNRDLQALGIEAVAKNTNQASQNYTGFANLCARDGTDGRCKHSNS